MISRTDVLVKRVRIDMIERDSSFIRARKIDFERSTVEGFEYCECVILRDNTDDVLAVYMV